MLNRKLAVLVPVRNGGELLSRSVQSIGGADLKGVDVEVLVFDNVSDDGAADALPSHLANGIPVRVARNECDLGRVGNWNRCVESARAAGFEYATFLFAGDTWLEGSAVRDLLARMDDAGACLGLAAYQMVREDGSLLCHSPRISSASAHSCTSVRDLFGRMMRRGHIPITPLQANIYRLEPDRPLLFDSDCPLTTDMFATIDFLCAMAGRVVVSAEPFAAWLARSGRVFCSSGLDAFLADHFRQLEYAATRSGIELDYGSAKSVFVSSYLRSALQFGGWRSLPSMVRKTMREAGSYPGSLNPADMARLVIDKFLFGRSALHLS